MTQNWEERRRHRRIDVNVPCRLTVGDRHHSRSGGLKSLIFNISMGGAAIRFAVALDKPPAIGTPVNLYIGGIGDFPSRVMRVYEGGIALAFKPLKSWDRQLVGKLENLLSKYLDEA